MVDLSSIKAASQRGRNIRVIATNVAIEKKRSGEISPQYAVDIGELARIVHAPMNRYRDILFASGRVPDACVVADGSAAVRPTARYGADMR